MAPFSLTPEEPEELLPQYRQRVIERLIQTRGRSLSERSLEHLSLEELERALREALPPVRYEKGLALSDGQFIDHPEYGLGLVSSPYQLQFIDVRFRTGSYSFSGPRQEAFRQAVQQLLRLNAAEEPAAARWHVLNQLGWGREDMDSTALREQILARLSLVECCELGAWLGSQKRTLGKALSKWDEDAEGKLAAALCPGHQYYHRIAMQVMLLGQQAHDAVLADPSRALALDFLARLKAVEPLAMGFGNPFADALPRYPDSDHLPALRELHPPRYHPSMTWRGYAVAVESRQHGPGVIVGAGAGDEGVRVVFPHGEYTLRGEEPPTPREIFLERAWDAIMRDSEPAPEPVFWSLIAQLGWGRPTMDRAELARTLASKLSPLELEAMFSRLFELRSALSKHLEAWEERKGGQQIEAGDDSFSDLVCHIIGLGEAEYRKVIAKPSLAAKRARKNDYIQSFDFTFLRARQEYSVAQVEQALRQALKPVRYEPAEKLREGQPLEHPEHGLGFVLAAPEAGSVRVIFPDAERALASSG
jgi:hypothetical protein